MDAHPTLNPANKAQLVKSKYKKISEAPKQKIKDASTQRHRRTFGTIRNPNVPEKPVSDTSKAKAPIPISLKQQKTEREAAPLPKTESGKKTSENMNVDRRNARKNKSVSFTEKGEGSVAKNSPAREVDGVKTPVRPPFSVKPVRNPGTPYLSAEKCSTCRFDRLETASYWLNQIKSSESVCKHFVSVTFFRLAHDCKAEPLKNLEKELKKYLTRHEHLSKETKWKDISRIYGILKKEHKTESSEDCNEMAIGRDSKLVDTTDGARTTN